MEYKISVIIPTYNAEDYLLEAVNSIRKQTIGFENIELILVDDNSNDNTKAILHELSNEPNIKSIFLSENSGTASQPRNEGIKAATSNYIMFLDNDDIYYPQICEVMHNAIDKNNADVASCRYDINKKSPHSFTDDFNPKNYKNFKGIYDEEKGIMSLESLDDFRNIMTLGHPTMIWTKIFRRSFILENNIEFPKGDLYEDVYFCAKSYINAKGIIILNNFWGYGYQLRTEGENKSTCQIFSKSMLEKQLRGFLKIMDLIDKEGKFNTLKSELIIDMTKIYMYADIEKECQTKFLNIMKKYYNAYKITNRVNTTNLPSNLVINVFIKIFSLNNNLAIFIKNLFLKIRR